MEASQNTPPVDRHNIVYIIFVWLGVGTLLPWNFFITQNSYWNYRYRDLSCEESNATDVCVPSDPSNMQKMWTSKMAVASMVPNVTMLILNAIFGHRFKTQPRLLVSLVLVIILFGVTAGLTKISTDHWQSSFMTLTLITVVFINLNAAIFQGGLAGVVSKFPSAYIGAVYSGQAISGIFASATAVIMRILRDSIDTDKADTCEECAKNEAFFCFLIAVIFLIATLFLYVISVRSKFYQFYFQDVTYKMKIENEQFNDLENESSDTSPLLKNNQEYSSVNEKSSTEELDCIPSKASFQILFNFWKVFCNISHYAISVMLIFVVSLSCFPGVTVRYESFNSKKYPTWAEKYFILVCCFVLFNVGDYVGRFAAEKVQWPKPGKVNVRFTFGSSLILFLSTFRVIFIPLFIYINEFKSDTAYIVLMLLFSSSQGYLCNISMMSAPKICNKEDQVTASNIMVAFLGIGLCLGALLSCLISYVFF